MGIIQTPQTKLLVLILKHSPLSSSSAKQKRERRPLAPSTPPHTSAPSFHLSLPGSFAASCITFRWVRSRYHSHLCSGHSKGTCQAPSSPPPTLDTAVTLVLSTHKPEAPYFFPPGPSAHKALCKGTLTTLVGPCLVFHVLNIPRYLSLLMQSPLPRLSPLRHMVDVYKSLTSWLWNEPRAWAWALPVALLRVPMDNCTDHTASNLPGALTLHHLIPFSRKGLQLTHLAYTDLIKACRIKEKR